MGKIGKISPFLFLPCGAHGANERLQIAAIGVGGKGGSDLQQIARHGDLVAACDISTQRLDYALRNYPKAAKFYDYREMFSHMGDKIDALSISTPDHTHAHAAQLAINQGIHLFIQAPLAHSVWEVSQLVKATSDRKICTQLGLQGWGSDEFRIAVEYLVSGELGNVEEVHAWTNRPLWPQSPDITERLSGTHSLPSGFHWDVFLGPAEKRPYHRGYQPYNWRGWRAFGSGALGDVGCHLLNLPIAGFERLQLSKVNCLSVGPVNQETYPSWGIVKFDFLDGLNSRNVPIFWYEGRIGHLSKTTSGKANLPPADLFFGRDISPNGCLIRCTKGTIYSTSIYGIQWELNIEGKWLKQAEIAKPKQVFPRNGRGDEGMKDELVYAIRKGKPNIASANLNSSKKLSEITILGNIALYAGGSFKWDSSSLTTNRPEVNNLLTKSYRYGWKVKSA